MYGWLWTMLATLGPLIVGVALIFWVIKTD